MLNDSLKSLTSRQRAVALGLNHRSNCLLIGDFFINQFYMQVKIKMQFDPQVAKDVGVEEAIMYSNIEFWVEHNKANNKNKHDGYYWTYNSMRAFCDLFPFWTQKQIRRILNNLINNGYIKTGNYNKSNYDRTKWYTTIEPYRKIDLPKKSNRKNHIVQPIPDNKPDTINTDNTYVEKTPSQIAKSFFLDEEKQKEFLHLLTEKGINEQIATNEINKFILYWTEPNKTGTKERWQLQKTFEVKRRLLTWFNRSNNFNYQKETKGITI